MSSQGVEYGPDVRYRGVKFGNGDHWLVEVEKGVTMEILQKEALRLGWANGCPIARELTGPNSPYDLEWMVRRYATANFWYRMVLHEVQANKAVYELLSEPRLRLPTETVGKHEPLSVPRSHLWRISPMSGIDGYATPRIAIEIFNKHTLRGDPHETVREVLRDATGLAGTNPGNFLAILAEKAVRLGVEPERFLRHVYPRGILEEENCKITFWVLAKTLDQHAPTVWRTYLLLPETQKEELELAQVPEIITNKADYESW